MWAFEGRRLYRFETGLFLKTGGTLMPTQACIGDYWQNFDDIWFVYSPAGIGSLVNHDVKENSDGTITVSPSILITGESQWHGYIENGIWREA